MRDRCRADALLAAGTPVTGAVHATPQPLNRQPGTSRLVRRRGGTGGIPPPTTSLLDENAGSGRSAAWLAHLVWDQRVAGSNPAAPTCLGPAALAAMGASGLLASQNDIRLSQLVATPAAMDLAVCFLHASGGTPRPLEPPNCFLLVSLPTWLHDPVGRRPAGRRPGWLLQPQPPGMKPGKAWASLRRRPGWLLHPQPPRMKPGKAWASLRRRPGWLLHPQPPGTAPSRTSCNWLAIGDSRSATARRSARQTHWPSTPAVAILA